MARSWFLIINRTTGKVVEKHYSYGTAERAERALNAHEIAHRDAPENAAQKFLELMDSSAPLVGGYYMVEKDA